MTGDEPLAASAELDGRAGVRVLRWRPEPHDVTSDRGGCASAVQVIGGQGNWTLDYVNVRSMRNVLAMVAATLACVLGFATPATAIPASITKSVTKPKGLVILVHGGGWRPSTTAYMDSMQPAAASFRAKGWSTRIQAQHGGIQSYTDVIRAATSYKQTIGKRPLCLYGESAGGHLAALTAAALGTKIKCVIGVTAPMWLDFDRDTPDHAYARDLAIAAFGEQNLRAFSPLTYAAQTKANVLLAYATNDPIVPNWHAPFYAYQKPGTKTVSVGPGSVRWVHSNVASSALTNATAAIMRFLAAQA